MYKRSSTLYCIYNHRSLSHRIISIEAMKKRTGPSHPMIRRQYHPLCYNQTTGVVVLNIVFWVCIKTGDTPKKGSCMTIDIYIYIHICNNLTFNVI